MLKGKVKIHTAKGKESEVIPFEFPEGWDEIDFITFRKLLDNELNKEDRTEQEIHYKRLEIITGVAAEKWAISQKDSDVPVIAATLWLYDSSHIFSQEVPEAIELGGQMYEVPQDMESLTLFQMDAIKSLITAKVQEHAGEEKEEQAGNMFFELYPNITAIVMQPFIDDTFPKYDKKKIEYYTELFGKEPVAKIFPVSHFFLSKQIESMENGLNVLNGITAQKKSKPMLKGWKSLGTFLRTIRLRQAIRRSLKRS